MTERESKGNKRIYVLLLLLLLVVILGIWQCPKTSVEKPSDELDQVVDNSIIVKPVEKEPIDSSIVKVKKTNDLPATTIPIKESPLKVEAKQEEIIPKEKKEIEVAVVVKTINKSLDKSSPKVSEKSCSSPSIFKIDKTVFQRCVAFSPDGSKFTVGNNDNQSSVFNMEGKELFSLKGHSSYILSTDYSSDGKYITTGSADKTVKIWNASSGKLIRTLNEHISMVSSVDFSPNGKYILTGSVDSSAILWDLKSGNKLLQLEDHKMSVQCVAFSPNSQYVMSSSADRTAKLRDINSGKTIFSLQHDALVRWVSFSPNGKFIITAAGKKIRIWDAKSGKHIRTIAGHKSNIRSIDISADSQKILTASGDKSIRLWDLNSGLELCKLEGHSAAVNEAVFHPINNNLVVSVSNDKTVRMWKIEL